MSSPSALAVHLGRQIRASRTILTGRWLERIAARVSIPPGRVFPSDDLLDHMPLLIDGIAAHLESAAETIPADSQVVYHARELGSLRHSQGFNEYEILKEFEILGRILFSFVMTEAAAVPAEDGQAPAFECASRLFASVALIQQATTTRFLELANRRVAEREDRLRAFHRALTHEMRNRIGATLGAGQLLQSFDLAAAQRADLTGVIVRNADHMRLVLENLLELSRLDVDTRQQRHVRLSAAIHEAARELRELAADRGVDIRVASAIPAVDVNAAAVELCLVNLLSNAIKYADPRKQQRWVNVSVEADAGVPEATSEVIVTVEDNGIGLPGDSLNRVFERFYRAHADATAVEGTGLGLSLVQETVQTIGGRVWVERGESGARFMLALPCRRAADVSLHDCPLPTT